MGTKGIIIIAIVLAIIIVGSSTLFTVDETETVIITQFGEYIRTVKEPGLKLKTPFIQTIHYFDKRVLEYDAAPAEILTKDKKNLLVDNYARWKIIDPLKLYQTVRNVRGAQARLADIIYADLREELAKHNLSDVIDIHREGIMKTVSEKSAEKARQYGIKIIDVRIKRADLPHEVAESVYARMNAERHRIAKKYRSQGEEEAAKIRAETDKQRAIILAEAYRQAQTIKGKAEAEAIKIYADAFRRDPRFYDFIRTLESYQKIIDKETTVILRSDSELFKYIDILGK
ncbi:MAG: protease modulator HflC [Deltaproteobacteria bacterium]|nr:protease modulator HflC [Deltaproteobacteria bacterium]